MRSVDCEFMIISGKSRLVSVQEHPSMYHSSLQYTRYEIYATVFVTL